MQRCLLHLIFLALSELTEKIHLWRNDARITQEEQVGVNQEKGGRHLRSGNSYANVLRKQRCLWGIERKSDQDKELQDEHSLVDKAGCSSIYLKRWRTSGPQEWFYLYYGYFIPLLGYKDHAKSYFVLSN